MNRQLVLALLALPLLALAGVACTEKGDTVISTAPEQVGITVNGTGEVVVQPDTGYFSAGINVTRATVADARDAAATAAKSLIDSIKANGVDAKDITTASFSISPQYSYPRDGGQPTITGYQVSNIVSVKVRNLDKFSKIVDDATAAGGNATVISGIRFGLEDDKEAIEQARKRAMDDAKDKAGQLASAGGVTLGKPVAISEYSASTPALYEADKAAGSIAQTPDATPIEPGSGKVTINVTVRYAIVD